MIEKKQVQYIGVGDSRNMLPLFNTLQVPGAFSFSHAIDHSIIRPPKDSRGFYILPLFFLARDL